MLHFSYQKKDRSLCHWWGPPPEDLTPAEELALTSNRGRPLVEGIEGGTSSGYVQDQYVEGIDHFLSVIMMVCLYLSVVGDTICLLDPQTTEDTPNPCVSSCIQFNFLSLEILYISCILVISYFNNCSLMAPEDLRHSMMKLHL